MRHPAVSPYSWQERVQIFRAAKARREERRRARRAAEAAGAEPPVIGPEDAPVD